MTTYKLETTVDCFNTVKVGFDEIRLGYVVMDIETKDGGKSGLHDLTINAFFK
jgi:hypothetical protein